MGSTTSYASDTLAPFPDELGAHSDSNGAPAVRDPLPLTDQFAPRHIGPNDAEIAEMLALVGVGSLEELSDRVVPNDIRLIEPLELPPAVGETEAIARLRALASQNLVFRSFIGMGYHDTITPPVIQRNILENPGWYTQYTPYQAEVSQGRLEALLNFQTMVADLTGLPLAGASLLDEGTAAAEAMAMCFSIAAGAESRNRFLVAHDCHPQTIEVVRTRAEALGIRVDVAPAASLDLGTGDVCGLLVQYPTTDGRIVDYRDLTARAHQAGALVVVAADLLALTLLVPPGEFGADIAIGTSQRFGVPMGYGGPHAAYIATHTEHARRLPGRIIGVSRDAQGNPAYRMAIQTREQHIRRERATSNICTAQALLAIMAGMYAVYHGPNGLRAIANRVHRATRILAEGLRLLGYDIGDEPFFDTLRVRIDRENASEILAFARQHQINLREYADGSIGIALDEAVETNELRRLLDCFAGGRPRPFTVEDIAEHTSHAYDGPMRRTSAYLTHPVFNTHHSETELLRYIFKLQSRDLSLAHSMIPLGSCTMKLNATSEMLPVTWPEFARLHPFAPADQARGYLQLFAQLEAWLSRITGFPAISLQPNAGSQGEYAGLLVIRAFHAHRGEPNRNVCIIPTSAHGTNPASAVIAGFRVVPVRCDESGNIDVEDLKAKCTAHANELGVLMVTYPSTHGVFETAIREICRIVHEHGGQVYMDGANLNAQIGLCSPAGIGADVCHLNLHKTFCIPHGGGGPGMGPIGVASHLAPFLPGHPIVSPFVNTTREHRPNTGRALVPTPAASTVQPGSQAIGPISAAPWGSPSILTISWMYIAMMGVEGLTRATQLAILNANYMAKRLEEHYDVVYRGPSGLVAHEFILDLRSFKKSAGIEAEDVAKRLMDYGFHAPTMSWPVAGTLMIEPTESESKAELDRFCDAMIAIRREIEEIAQGTLDREDNPLTQAPHSAHAVTADEWKHPYTRERAAFPAEWLRDFKFWPPVGRVDNPYGDRNLVCTCPPMEAYNEG